jgi:hypothetical protein
MPCGHAKNGFRGAITIGAPTLPSLLINTVGSKRQRIHSYLSTRKENMEKTVINEVFDMLHGIKAVDSESEFSRDWLGRSECYLRTLRFKGAKPSIGAIAICASKLQHYGNQLVDQTNHRELGARFLTLSERCHAQINAQSRAIWRAKK